MKALHLIFNFHLHSVVGELLEGRQLRVRVRGDLGVPGGGVVPRLAWPVDDLVALDNAVGRVQGRGGPVNLKMSCVN